MKVELIAHTLQPENIVAAAAKLCYSKVDASEIMMNLDPAKVEGFVTHLMTLGHESPIEHVSFTFAIEGVSRVLSHQPGRTGSKILCSPQCTKSGELAIHMCASPRMIGR